jgi:hypothetical protein
MSVFSDKVRAAFQAREARVVTVPEWGMELFIYPITLAQLEAIYEDDSDYGVAARTILVRAKNEDGSPAFTKGDLDELRKFGVEDYGPAVIARIAREINAPDDLADDEQSADDVMEELAGN